MQKIICSITLLLTFFLFACQNRSSKEIVSDPVKILNEFDSIVEEKIKEPVISEIEQVMINAGLVNIHELDTSIKVDLKYSTTDNFLGIVLYDTNFNECYLQKSVAEKLVQAQKLLKDSFPDYSLIVFDATRPRSVQQMMWDSIKVSAKERPKYVSNPQLGSLHNFGAAVDVSIIDANGNLLDMGTPYDSFEELAYPILEKENLEKGLLKQNQVNNRHLLKYCMHQAGFFNIQTEWWHFNDCYRKVAQEKYAMIENKYLPVKDDVIVSEQLPVEEVSLKDVNITFQIQILAVKKRYAVDDKIFKGLDVHMYQHNGMYKYTTGIMSTVEEAYKKREEIVKMGFDQAFIAAFNNGQRIGIRDAIELVN